MSRNANIEIPFTQKDLHEFISYDPFTGIVKFKRRDRKWFNDDRMYKIWNKCYANMVAGSNCKSTPHSSIRFFGERYLMHRVIWKWMTGEEPLCVGHKNKNGIDNRWSNLISYNDLSLLNYEHYNYIKDNKSGCRGVYWDKRGHRWLTSIRFRGKNIFLGGYKNYDDAVKVRKNKEEELKKEIKNVQ